jgi:hypothetical protein
MNRENTESLDLALPEIQPGEGKDELNLAEFPLAVISSRPQPDLKTLCFEDRVWDMSRSEMVTRKLIITASDEYGLPTALDEEVILGLVQLSKLQNFASRKVTFSRYQLIRLLKWRDESKSYERLEKALNRWVGVTLIYKNAWWSKEEECWVDEKFHILDNVTLFDKDRIRRKSKTGRSSQESSFIWNEVIFRSFKAGNLKSLDFDFFLRLKSSISKRLYRFLDKRFYRRHRWEFDLKELCWEHIGLSRNYDAANLKRRLKNAISELESVGYLKLLSEEERFKKVRSGEWRIFFEKETRTTQSRTPDRKPESNQDGLFKALTDRGITPLIASETIAKYPSDRISAQLEVFDWLMETGDSRVSKNPPGYLITSIRSEYLPPRGFLTKEEREKKALKEAERKQKLEEKRQREEERRLKREQAREDAIKDFWDSLSEEERSRTEEEAIENASVLQRDLIRKGGTLAQVTRKLILDDYALQMLATIGG